MSSLRPEDAGESHLTYPTLIRSRTSGQVMGIRELDGDQRRMLIARSITLEQRVSQIERILGINSSI